MSNLAEVIRTPIIQPAFTQRYKVGFSKDESDVLTRATIEATFDMVNRRIDLVMRENIDGDVIRTLRTFLIKRFSVDLYLYGSSGDPKVATTFDNCAISGHKIAFSYENSEIVNHYVTISY